MDLVKNDVDILHGEREREHLVELFNEDDVGTLHELRNHLVVFNFIRV